MELLGFIILLHLTFFKDLFNVDLFLKKKVYLIFYNIVSVLCYETRGILVLWSRTETTPHEVEVPCQQRFIWSKLWFFQQVMYGCESWTIKKTVLKNWCFWTVVLEKTLESPLDSKEIEQVNPKGNQCIFIGRTDAEAEAPVLWSPDVKSWLTGKDPDIGKNWMQENGVTEDEIVGWCHQLKGQEFEQIPEDGEGQGRFVTAVHRVAKSQTWLSV